MRPSYRLRAPREQQYFTLGFRLAHDVSQNQQGGPQ